MTKKEFIAPYIFVFLSVAFMISCLFVYLTNGKSAKWLSRKMKMGAFLLSLTASIESCGPIHKCYAPPSPDYMWITGLNSNYELVINDSTNSLKGLISMKRSENFSYAIVDTSGNIIRKGNILQKGEAIPLDGKSKLSTEEIQIEIDKNIEKGKYELRLFNVTPEMQLIDRYRTKFILIIE